MAAYVIVNIDVKDPARYREYIEAAPATIALYGGRYLARGGRAQRLEGSWETKRVVVLEFPSFERAQAWWSSEEYAGPRALRRACSEAEMIVVDGI